MRKETEQVAVVADRRERPSLRKTEEETNTNTDTNTKPGSASERERAI